MDRPHHIHSNGVIPPTVAIKSLNKMGVDFRSKRPKHFESDIMECVPVSTHCPDTTTECTIVMNGHFNPHNDREPLTPQDCEDEEAKHYVNHQDIFRASSRSSQMSDTLASTASAASTLVSTMKGSSFNISGDESAAEDDSDVDGGEPESSRHLLKEDEEEDDEELPSPKCVRSKPKIPAFKSSPTKKSNDPHSHIQHRPLRQHPTCGSLDSQNETVKYGWTVVKFICAVIVISLLVAGTCVIVGLFLTAPLRCEVHRSWWQASTTYEIFAASFQDTDADGFGDLRGIAERLDYVKNLSVDVIRLNSIFSALDYPLEYEHVIDFSNVDPHIGRLDDFKDLVSRIHEKNMYLVLDLNPTRTSDQHTWAAHWLLHRPGKYENFYVNVTDEEDEPPMEPNQDYVPSDRTNPHRTFGGHLLLNWSNPLMQEEMLQVLDFWLQLGVDGFYMKHLEDLRVHDWRDLGRIIHVWRSTLDRHTLNGTQKVLMVSLTTIEYFQKLIDPPEFQTLLSFFDVVDAGINFSANRTLEASDEVWKVRKWTSEYSNAAWVSWHFGSVETSRLADRVGKKYVMNCVFLLSLLPGSISLFYGDEIGMEDSYDVFSKKIYRGGQLAPMQWTSSANANFTDPSTQAWISVHPNSKKYNVEYQSKTLYILKHLLSFKKASLYPPQQHTHQPTTKSVMRNIVAKIQNMEYSEPNYRWFHDAQTSLVALVVSYDPTHKFVLFANFGTNVLIPDYLGSRKDGVRKWNDLEFNRMKVIFATDTVSIKSPRMRDAHLDPGQAILCLYIT